MSICSLNVVNFLQHFLNVCNDISFDSSQWRMLLIRELDEYKIHTEGFSTSDSDMICSVLLYGSKENISFTRRITRANILISLYNDYNTQTYLSEQEIDLLFELAHRYSKRENLIDNISDYFLYYIEDKLGKVEESETLTSNLLLLSHSYFRLAKFHNYSDSSFEKFIRDYLVINNIHSSTFSLFMSKIVQSIKYSNLMDKPYSEYMSGVSTLISTLNTHFTQLSSEVSKQTQ